MIGNSTTTTIWPPIPRTDMTPLEKLLLTTIFDAKEEGDSLSFSTPHGPSDIVTISRGDLASVLAESANVADSMANRHVAARLDTASQGEDVDPLDDFDLTISRDIWEQVLQDIVRRSSTIAEVIAKSATVPNRPPFDDLDATSVTLVTATAIRHKTLADALENLRDDTPVISKRTVNAAMSLWSAALAFRHAVENHRPIQRSVHRMLDAWDEFGDHQMRDWLVDVADFAVLVAQNLAAEPDAYPWSFEGVIAPSILNP